MSNPKREFHILELPATPKLMMHGPELSILYLVAIYNFKTFENFHPKLSKWGLIVKTNPSLNSLVFKSTEKAVIVESQ